MSDALEPSLTLSLGGILYLSLGQVVRTHGLKGGFVVTNADRDSALGYLNTLFILDSSESLKTLTVLEANWMPSGWKLTTKQIQSHEMAKPLLGKHLYARRADLKQTADNEFYVSDLVGCEVFELETGKKVGVFVSAEPAAHQDAPGAQERWWVELAASKESLSLPAVKRYIARVDLEKRQIWLQNLSDFRETQ